MELLPQEFDSLLDLDDDFEELEYQPHRTDDPNIWGLLDVAVRRWTEVPQTIYLISGDSASKPVGLLMPDGTFTSKSRTRVGDTFIYQDGGADDGQMVPASRQFHGGHGLNAPLPTKAESEVVWDGAMPSPTLDVVVDGETFITEEHSRGLILGDYSRNAVDSYKSKLNASRNSGLVEQDVHSTSYEHNQRQMTDPDWSAEVRGGSRPRYPSPSRFPEAA